MRFTRLGEPLTDLGSVGADGDPTPLQDPAPLADATTKLQASDLFTQVTGPLNPAGAPLSADQYAQLHATLGPAKLLPPVPPPGTTVPPAVYQAYRATSNYVSPDGKTVQYSTSLQAGDPGTTAAMR